ncbi:hypothetical protein GRF29_213g338465 [Pseudopithomyces chartarum]|uniref:Uncharacterized protein n=1 Tax=Pseudopithomyces chartarum TaxID=1892770 RepID=A0AAN6LMZ8_9PLEO|nr:hypothetical protein GRF29_213g338465 [Pseudopithomyces chartarum]
MGRMSSRTSSPEKRQLGLLSDQISELGDIEYTAAITTLAELVPGLNSSLSSTGERLVHHEAYKGSANLNDLARKWMRTGSQCKHHKAPLSLRLQQLDLLPYFQKLYETTENDIEQYRFARICNGFREFSLVCAHCIGHPWVAIPQESSHSDDALLFEDADYKRIWPKQKASGGSFGPDPLGEKGGYKSLSRATKKQLEDAVARGVES